MKSHEKFLNLSILVSLILTLSNVSAVAAAPLPASLSQNDADTVINNGFDYIATQINQDGGIRWMDDTSNVAATIRVVMALAAVHYPQDYLVNDTGNRPIDFLAQSGSAWVNQVEADEPAFNVARAGQLLTAISAANENPHHFGEDSLNLIYDIKAAFDPSTGVFGVATNDNVTDQVWAILGLASSHASIPPEAVNWLANTQLEDGSWNDGFGSYLDTTPLALLALAASDQMGSYSTEVQAATSFMRSNQNEVGGWQTEWDTTTNADTTAMMLQAISSLGQLPMDDNWQLHSGNPYTALLALSQDNGAIGGDYANTYSTADAIIGLSGQPVFNLSSLKRISISFDYIFDSQQPDGGWGTMGQTIDVLLALKAAGWDPNSVQQNGETPLSYMTNNLTAYIESGPDAIGKSIMGIVAMGENPNNITGIDLISELNAVYDQVQGAFGTADNTRHQALAILGLYAASEPIPEDVISTLVELKQNDGGWEYNPGSGTSPDSTALAIQALLASGKSTEDATVQNGIAYLQSSQTTQGDWGDSSNTAFAIMAINALDHSPEDWKVETGMAPLSSLFSYQKANGAFVYNWEFTDDNLLSTTASLIAALSSNYLVTAPYTGDTHYAALVIDPGDEAPTSLCVPFSEESLSGFEFLDASDIDYDLEEGFLTSIMGKGNPQGETLYWSYWSFDGRDWNFYNAGAGDTIVKPTAIQGWHLTSWERFPSLPPDVIPNLSKICDVEVLKDVTMQPYLNYEAVANPFKTQKEPASLVSIEESTPSEETTGINEVTPTITSQEERSNLPLYIIGGIGLFLIAVVVFFVLKRNK